MTRGEGRAGYDKRGEGGGMTRGEAPGVEDGGCHVAALGVHAGELGPLEALGVQRVEVVWWEQGCR